MKFIFIFLIINSLTSQIWAADQISAIAENKTNILKVVRIKGIQANRSPACAKTDKKCGDVLESDINESLEIREYQANSLIEFDSSKFRADNSTDPKFRRLLVLAHLTKQNFSVLYKDKYILSNSKERSDFTILIEIPKKTNKVVVVFTIIDTLGNIRKEKFWIKYSSDEIELVNKNSKVNNLNIFSMFSGEASLFAQSINYNEFSSKYQSITINGNLGINYNFSRKWEIKASTQIGIAPISTNNTNFMRIIGVNALFGYNTPYLNRWSFGAFGGGYFLTSIVYNNAFGFANLYGPQILFFTKRNFVYSDVLIWLKGSLLNKGLAIQSLSNKEVLAGVKYSFQIENQKLFINADVSYCALPSLYSDVSLAKFSLGLGVNF